jgi:hypothetical protein
MKFALFCLLLSAASTNPVSSSGTAMPRVRRGTRLPPISGSSASPPLVNFSYIPLNHIDSTDGSYACTDDPGRPFGDWPSTT